MSEQFIAHSPAVGAGTKKVASGIEMLAKKNHNKFGGYNFITVDDMFAMTGPLMADAGINIVADEIDATVENKHLTINYNIYVTHESGEYVGPYKRSIQVQATGPQAYGSAESYVLKQFMRGYFKIPTGEAEEETFNNNEKDPSSAMPERKAVKAKPATVELMGVADSARERDTLLASLTLCTSKDAMLVWADKTEKLREQMHEADKQVLRDAFKDQQAALKGKAA